MSLKKYIGIDIGGTAVKTGIVDELGTVEARMESQIDTSCERESVMQTVCRSIRELAAANSFGLDEAAGIGVAAPGSIDTKSGKVAINGGNVPNWSGTAVCTRLNREFALPVSVANDGNCVALAEAWVGAARGYSDVLCVVVGTGIGGGIISGGRLIEGARGYAGEIGHILTHAGGKKCKCGGRGCFERYASTSALVEKAAEVNGEWNSGIKLFKAAGDGNADALKLIDKWTDELACGIGGLVHIFNPEIVLIGGGVSVQEELVIKPVQTKIKEHIMEDFSKDLMIKRASLGNAAGMVGGVKHLMDEQFMFLHKNK